MLRNEAIGCRIFLERAARDSGAEGIGEIAIVSFELQLRPMPDIDQEHSRGESRPVQLDAATTSYPELDQLPCRFLARGQDSPSSLSPLLQQDHRG